MAEVFGCTVFPQECQRIAYRHVSAPPLVCSARLKLAQTGGCPWESELGGKKKVETLVSRKWVIRSSILFGLFLKRSLVFREAVFPKWPGDAFDELVKVPRGYVCRENCIATSVHKRNEFPRKLLQFDECLSKKFLHLSGP